MAVGDEDENKNDQKKRFHKKSDKPLVLPKSLAGQQRMKLEKLMNDVDKPVYIPEGPKQRQPRAPPEFVRDVMGSSAGAGSGEFHIYRGYRRRELIRQIHMDEKHEKDTKDEEFQERMVKHKQEAESRTAKKRAKRQRKKQKQLAKKQKLQKEEQGEEQKSDDSGSDEEEKDGEEKDDDADSNCFVIGGK